jgi:hypothetical protein
MRGLTRANARQSSARIARAAAAAARGKGAVTIVRQGKCAAAIMRELGLPSPLLPSSSRGLESRRRAGCV